MSKDQDQKRMFYSTFKRLAIVLTVKGKDGRVTQKTCQFTPKNKIGQYYALSVGAEGNILDQDEYVLLKAHPSFNLRFFDAKGWMNEAKKGMDEPAREILEEKDRQIEALMAKLEEQKSAQAIIAGKEVPVKSMPNPQKAKPKGKTKGK